MISALIPAYQEAERIEATVCALKALPYPLEIVVVDDGSHDETARLAEAAGADVVIKQRNRGKGAALRTALAHAAGDTLLLLDADIGASASEAVKLLEPILRGEADMTIALFVQNGTKGGGLGFVVRRARKGILKRTGRTMQAPLSGQRALRRDVAETCGGFADGWGVEVALTVRALWLGYRVLEVPVTMSHRVTGRDIAGVWHRFRQFLGVGRAFQALAPFAPKEKTHHG